MMVPGIIVFGAVIAGIIAAFCLRQTSKRLSAIERNLESTKTTLRQAEDKNQSLEAQGQRQRAEIDDLKRLLAEKSSAMPWIAECIADLYWAVDERDARRLATKKHPARSAAEAVREHALEKRELRRANRLSEYRVAFYESLFPWLKDIGYSDAESIAETKLRDIGDSDDPAAAWLSQGEWASLPSTERFQRALERYQKRKKSDWEIGRDYERYIGYKWEVNGYDVTYYGAIKGFEDFGRDLIITTKKGTFALIQCKYWSRHKIIPEAAVFQLLGSTVSFYIEKTGHAPKDLAVLFKYVKPLLFTSTELSQRLKEIAAAMGIELVERYSMPEWPMVKCNISAQNERIYHLPMDQQYDRVKLLKPGECFVATVLEAEEKGFRRAKRWLGGGSPDGPRASGPPLRARRPGS